MWMGLFDARFEGPGPQVEAPHSDPREVLHANTRALASLAQEVDALARLHELGDYGRFRLAVLAIDHQPVDVSEGAPLHTVAGGLAAGAWSADSRTLAIGGLLRALDYGVAIQGLGEGRIALALPLADDMDALNANLIKASIRVRRGKGIAQTVQFRWLLWAGEGRIGDPRSAGESLLPVQELLDGPERRFSFASRSLPAFTLQRPEPRIWTVPGRNDTLSYDHHEDARRWLEAFPALTFAHQTPIARQELAAMGMGPSLRALVDPLDTDRERVDLLLRTVQTALRYQEGPLRSLFEMFVDGTADCDQLSLVLAAMLVEVGWQPSDLRALQWPGHLALGVRPRDDSGPDGVHVDIGGIRFHALDGAYIEQTGDILTSRWGQLHQRYARLRFAPSRIG